MSKMIAMRKIQFVLSGFALHLASHFARSFKNHSYGYACLNDRPNCRNDRAMNPSSSALFTDLYQLTMLQGYYAQGMEDTAVFEFFIRRLPASRGFLLAAGLEQVLEYLENLRFTSSELAWVKDSGFFTHDFVDALAELRFTGDVHAMQEGTAFFPDEPILRVTAPLPEAQLIESRIINLLHFQSMIASKAARCVMAAPGKMLVDFGMRRAHGAEAGLLAARANYLAGFTGSATVLAAQEFGIPVFGTMAHSYIETHDDEAEAFEHFAQSQPDNVVLLIDTYDTERGAEKVVALAPRLREQGVARWRPACGNRVSPSRPCAWTAETWPIMRSKCAESWMMEAAGTFPFSPVEAWMNSSYRKCWQRAHPSTVSASAHAWTHREMRRTWIALTS